MEPTYQQRLINETLTIKAVNDTRTRDPYIGLSKDHQVHLEISQVYLGIFCHTVTECLGVLRIA